MLSGQAINEILKVDSPWVGIVIFGLLTMIVATIGYRLIHILGRVATVVGAIGFTYLAIRMLMEYDVPALLGAKPFDIVTFLLAVSLSAGWQLTFGPYVADYSRYLPRSTKESATFWGTFLGSVIGSQWSMTLGAIVAAAAGDEFLASQVTFIGDLAGGAVIALGIYLVIVTGKLAVNCLNAYGGLMTMLTTATAFTRTVHVPQWIRTACVGGFIVVSVLIALLASADFLENFRNFVLLILMAFTPWSAINLVDYYLISKERVDIPALYDPDGRYGRWNVTALVSYAIGIAIQVPFLAQRLYTGPLVDHLGGADISWLVGLFGTAAIYYLGAQDHEPAGADDLPGRCRDRDRPRPGRRVKGGRQLNRRAPRPQPKPCSPSTRDQIQPFRGPCGAARTPYCASCTSSQAPLSCTHIGSGQMRQCTTRRDSRENSDLPTLKMFLVCSSVNAARSNTVTGQPTGSQPPGRPVMTISSRPPAAAVHADTSTSTRRPPARQCRALVICRRRPVEPPQLAPGRAHTARSLRNGRILVRHEYAAPTMTDSPEEQPRSHTTASVSIACSCGMSALARPATQARNPHTDPTL